MGGKQTAQKVKKETVKIANSRNSRKIKPKEAVTPKVEGVKEEPDIGWKQRLLKVNGNELKLKYKSEGDTKTGTREYLLNPKE